MIARFSSSILRAHPGRLVRLPIALVPYAPYQPHKLTSSGSRAKHTTPPANSPPASSPSPNPPQVNLLPANPLHLSEPTSDTLGTVNQLIPEGLPNGPMEWSPSDVQTFLRHNQAGYYVGDNDIELIRKNNVPGRAFLRLTEKKLVTKYKMTLGGAAVIEELIGLINLQDSTQAAPGVVLHQRQKRWNELNNVLGPKKTKKKRMRLHDDHDRFTTGYSHASWEDVSPIFDLIRRPYEENVKEIPDSDLEILSTILSWIVKCYHSTLFDGNDNGAKRVHLIAPVLWSVVHLLPDVTVNVEQDLNGNRVNAHGHFEFVLTRGRKRVCIVEAKEERFKQGLAQNLLGCEVAADLDNSHEVYGIVTNFSQWVFLKSLDNEILCDEFNAITFDGKGNPVRNQLTRVVGKLYSLLA